MPNASIEERMMKKRTITHAIQVTFLIASLGTGTLHANPLALSETPLTVSTAINPNVMLLIDNSGSMEHIIWHQDFNESQTYGNWEYRNGSGNWVDINASDTYYPATFRRHSCPENFVTFRPNGGGTTKCLRLAAPNGNSNTRYLGRYLQFLLDRFSSGTDLTQGQIPNDYRMNVARDVASDLVTTTANMRFGVSRFNFQQGGSIVANCGAAQATLTTQINALTANSWTPLGESLYEITRYFRGLSSHYNTGVSYTSPIQYRCQKNFTIVITDGLPTYDGSYPNNDPDDPSRLLPNWDGIANDGTGAESPTERAAMYLDDIAKFAWDIDMRKTGNDLAGKSFSDPAFSRQNMYTYTVGFAVADPLLEDAARYGNGLYFTANNADQLKERLKAALTDIQSKLGSSSSAATSGGSIQTGSMIYQARMNSEDWSGQLLAFAINTDPTSLDYGKTLKTGSGPEGSQWDAGARINPENWNSRTIITNRANGVPFRWASFTNAEKSSFFNSTENLLEYLRGRAVSTYRTRNSALGDIVNSAPQYVGAPSALYPSALETVSYAAFKETNKNRTPMVYVGANDGMLHAFNANTGNETLAYIPGSVLGRLKHLSESSYKENHKFYVDGTPTIADAFVNNQWRTMLVGGLNRGGQGIYALDITNPSSFSESTASSIFSWEFTDANDNDLGFTYSRPAIVKLQNGTWAAIFGNGYNNTVADGNASATGNAALYIVNLHTGALIKKISTGTGTAQDPTGAGRPNGLATVTPVDIDGDYKIDYIYAGDLFGNMWKFDLNNTNTNQWGLDYKLFQACSSNSCTASNRQSITTRPTVIRHPSSGGQLVLFGTGKYLEPTDNNSTTGVTQSFYAIWDNNASQGKPVSRASLQQQSILAEQAVTFTSSNGTPKSETIRVTSNNGVDWGTKNGWYINLLSPNGFQGERQVTDSLVRNGQLIFTTMIPSSNATDPCAPSGKSWLMELNAYTGGRLEYTPFDLNGDRKFSTGDYATIDINGTSTKVPASGRQMDGGNAQTPAVAVDPKGNGEVKYVSTSEGLEQVVENTGRGSQGRQSWRELFPR